jgi:hypothetical protein
MNQNSTGDGVMRNGGRFPRKLFFAGVAVATYWAAALSFWSSISISSVISIKEGSESEASSAEPTSNSNRHRHQKRATARRRRTIVNTTDLSIFAPARLAEKTKTARSYDYEEFWNHAWKLAWANDAALQASQASQPTKTNTNFTLESCPKVYIYPLPKSLRDGDRDWETPELEKAFGKPVGLKGHLRSTYQFNLARILEYRLVTSNYCITHNPQEADLWFVPVLPNPKNLRSWEVACRAISAEALQQHLVYLNASTACRHFFVVSKTHMIAEQCLGWWHQPVTPEFRNAQRIAYTQDTFDKYPNSSYFYYDRNDTTTNYPNLVSLPHPTSLHWSTSTSTSRHNGNNGNNASLSSSPIIIPPWTQHSQRDILLLYIGRSYHGDVVLRTRVHDTCVAHGNTSMCTSVEPLATTNVRKSHNYIVNLKHRAVFCLEPGGDDTARKSIWDSLSYGCIPVLFHNLTDRLAPWLWGTWKHQARVLVDRERFLLGDDDDDDNDDYLYSLLRSIPQRLLDLMQDTIRQQARNIQYSLDDDAEDGIRLLLEGLKHHAEQMEERGVCRPPSKRG